MRLSLQFTNTPPHHMPTAIHSHSTSMSASISGGGGEEEAPRFKVQLAVYDLSQGMARQLGPTLLGMEIEAIYHTGIVVYGKEHFFGGGIVSVPHEEFMASYHMQPFQILELGETEVGEELFNEFLQEVSPRFTAETYDLMSWNCNNFSNEAALFLLGDGIPAHILALPEQVFSSPLGALLRPAIEQMQGAMRPAVPGFHFESYEGGRGAREGAGGGQAGHHHINNPPPLVPPHHMSPQAPLPAVPLNNPWANMRAASTTTTTTSTTSSSSSSSSSSSRGTAAVPVTTGKQQDISAPVESVLARHDKPLLSIDPPAVLKQTVSTVITKLKTLSTAAVTEEGKEDVPLFSPDDIALLEATEAIILQPLTPLPHSLASLLLRTLLPPWPVKAEFFSLSLLRPLFLRPTFPTPALLDHLLAKFSGVPSSFPSSSSSSFSSPSSVVIAFSGLSNVCAHKAGCKLLLHPSRATLATDAAVAALLDDRPAVRQMAAAFLANIALGMQGGREGGGEGAKEEGLSDVVVQMVCGTLEGLREDEDMTSVFRRLLCAGRMVKKGGREAGALVVSLGFDELLKEVGREGGKKGGVGKQVQELAREILQMVEEGSK